MILIIGGACQGKGELALKLAGGDKERVLLNVHCRIEEELRMGKSREEIQETILEAAFGRKDMVLTADEVGCGIIPMDASLRECRETTGRILCVVAGKAKEVYRVTAGIAQKIKG
ncbi:MAG: hypothetical protein HFI67_05055 [Lachnospiraceae bacterium]|jgi:adenosylcobinamide kinase/adenosylcobinamide-phosphate guanylyltransferase|nr:hypothetical protein [Lachnospiraceae bacterium]